MFDSTSDRCRLLLYVIMQAAVHSNRLCIHGPKPRLRRTKGIQYFLFFILEQNYPWGDRFKKRRMNYWQVRTRY